MCGIAGFFGDFDRVLLQQMSHIITHRGPDDEGLFFDREQGIGLAHRRLSIIELSALGHQPMWDRNHQVAIVFNGEIFNFRELRSVLQAQGHTFTSQSDTEVLLNLYLRDGERMLTQLNGMFAFAIWDSRQRTLFLARDGVGVKPLYYAATEKGFLFGSEMKSLLCYGGINRELNPEAIHYHLSYLWAPGRHTMLKAVQKLEPGFAMILRDGKIQRHWQHYDLPYDQPIAPYSESEAIELVRTHLSEAVKRQMVADVPVGAFLSGGLDSSAVVALARQHAPEQTLQCFTIGFKDDSPQREGMVEDLPFARKAASHLGVDLHTIYVEADMIKHLEKMIYHLDEPQADPAPINALLISELARDNGIKVLLSGTGGDDIFTGYPRHYALMQERYWDWLPRSARKQLSNLASLIPTGAPLGRRLSKAFRYADLAGDQRIASYFHYFAPALQASLYSSDLQLELQSIPVSTPLVDSLSRLAPNTSPLNRMLYLEGKHFLADHNLNYMDKMSMAAGVEVRVPFLDPDLIALAARLPISMKQRGREGKWVLKKAMEPYLPHDIIYRPKTGFGAPLRMWLRQELRPLVEDVLSVDAVSRRGLFEPAAINKLLELDRSGKVDAAYPIFSLVCMELWCRQFVDRPSPAAPFSPSLGLDVSTSGRCAGGSPDPAIGTR